MTQEEKNVGVSISIPTPLRPYTANQKRIQINGSTVNIAINALLEKYPKLEDHIFENGNLRNFVNVYLNDDDIRYLVMKGDTELKDGDAIYIIPSIAGGNN